METLIKTRRYFADLHPNKKTVYIIPSQDDRCTDAEVFEPRRRQPHRDAQGLVNFYEDADPAKDKYWREKIGKYLWDHVVKEDMRRKGISGTSPVLCVGRLSHADVLPMPVSASPDTFILAAYPKHYKLWIHKKGDPANPRTDHYLFGEPHGLVATS